MNSLDHAPLAGVIVVSLEQAISAPFCTRQLAELGATVIKVERPGGDFARGYDSIVHGTASYFMWANRGKQSIVLDLKDDTDRATFDALIAGADIFIHNIAPDAAQRAHIDAATLGAKHSGLIACEISGYGPGGPRSNDRAYDLAIQAEAGAFSVTGNDDVSKVGFSIADISAGMYSLTSILAALVRRDRTGEGAQIQVSMLDSVAEWMAGPMYGTVYSGSQPERTGRRHHGIAPYGTYTLSDGRVILIAVQNDREWERLARNVLQSELLNDNFDFATAQARIANVHALETEMNRVFAERDADEIVRLLTENDIAVARVNDLHGVWNHEQLRTRDRFETISIPDGQTAEVLKSPFDISNWVPNTSGVPNLDEHDDATINNIVERGQA